MEQYFKRGSTEWWNDHLQSSSSLEELMKRIIKAEKYYDGIRELDFDEFPTFGGEEPSIPLPGGAFAPFSWDEDNGLYQVDYEPGWAIVPREAGEEE